MSASFDEMLYLFSESGNGKLLSEGNFGLEKESQRVTPSGDLALTPHPAVFGDKLENTSVTTDFSESQIELITPPLKSVEETYESMKELQAEAENNIGEELLWPLSMPPRLPDEEKIPIARFKETPEGREKEIYRNGLALRYGKKMQMISGIHYNFSFSDEMLDFLYERLGKGVDKNSFKNDLYFSLIRNYLRYRWLLIYLFGSSPTFDDTYRSVIDKELSKVKRCCPECCNIVDQYGEFFTSLRVSRFGYSNTAQCRKNVSFNNVGEYVADLKELMKMKSKKYMKLGVFKEGNLIQLNENILQKESEFYSSIRPKQVVKNGESQLEALSKKGIRYLEARILDINPFEKTGISLAELHFLQVFMLLCLFEESKAITKSELDVINKNHHLVALCGRKPVLALYKSETVLTTLEDRGSELFQKLKLIAVLMDREASGKYSKAVEGEYRKLKNNALLPSSRILKEMKERNETFLDFGARRAKINKNETEVKNPL